MTKIWKQVSRNEIIVWNDSGVAELWRKSFDSHGYTLAIKGCTYKFVCNLIFKD